MFKRRKLKGVFRQTFAVISLSLCLAAIVVVLVLMRRPQEVEEKVAADQPLRYYAKLQNFRIGVVVGAFVGKKGNPRTQIAKREFNLLAIGQNIFWNAINSTRGQYDFTKPDEIVDFAQANNVPVFSAAVFVWDLATPEWLRKGVEEGSISEEELRMILKNHTQKVVGRYQGRIKYWAVANEIIFGGSEFWLKHLGYNYTQWIKQPYDWAHQADPNAKLLYNDYIQVMDGRFNEQQKDGVYKLVKSLKDQKAPIHGVGLQMHVNVYDSPSLEEIRSVIKYFTSPPLSMDVYITELDVAISPQEKNLDWAFQKQAEIFRNMTKACLDNSRCKFLNMWGITDWPITKPLGWLAGMRAHIYDEDHNPKPAYYAILDELKSFRPDLCGGVSVDKRSIKKGESVTITSETKAGTTADDFYYYAYNENNQYPGAPGSDNPKPICVNYPGEISSSDFCKQFGNNWYQLGFKRSLHDRKKASKTISFDELSVPDKANNNKVVTEVQFNAYFSNDRGFSKSDIKCVTHVKLIKSVPTPTPSPTSVLGDINNDGVVDIQDFILMNNVFGTSDFKADLNNDGIVDIQDYMILSNNFGKMS